MFQSFHGLLIFLFHEQAWRIKSSLSAHFALVLYLFNVRYIYTYKHTYIHTYTMRSLLTRLQKWSVYTLQAFLQALNFMNETQYRHSCYKNFPSVGIVPCMSYFRSRWDTSLYPITFSNIVSISLGVTRHNGTKWIGDTAASLPFYSGDRVLTCKRVVV